jgi:hypothetical protein
MAQNTALTFALVAHLLRPIVRPVLGFRSGGERDTFTSGGENLVSCLLWLMHSRSSS